MFFTLYTARMEPSIPPAVAFPSHAASQFSTLPQAAPSVLTSSELPSKMHPTAARDPPPSVVWSRAFEGFVDDDFDEYEYE